MDYDITMQPIYSALQKFSIAEAKQLSDHHWFNRTLCHVNDAAVRIGVLEGEFHWHSHEAEDELFFVLEGRLEIAIEGQETVVLEPMQGVVVPRGVRHRPSALDGCTVLMVEQNTVVPTGS
ncbi:MAG: cupin domain-containing protein [Myxococcales bacterium]|nr:cupin domain-containing protein [Myxococcales bacterium]